MSLPRPIRRSALWTIGPCMALNRKLLSTPLLTLLFESVFYRRGMSGVDGSSLFETWMREADEAAEVLGPPTDANYLATGCPEGEDVQLSAGDVLAMAAELAPATWPVAVRCALRRLDPVDLSHSQLVDYVQVIERQKAYLEVVT